jgi:toxin ParE1/3/4
VSTYVVAFSPEALEQLAEIVDYIAGKAAPDIADRYASAIISHCEGLQNFPHGRGTRRDDIRPGLRTTNYKGRTVIAFDVDDAAGTVSIIGIFYGGRDYETSLKSDF